jgi:hypothetical protein
MRDIYSLVGLGNDRRELSAIAAITFRLAMPGSYFRKREPYKKGPAPG